MNKYEEELESGKYNKKYSDQSFWKKIKSIVKIVGAKGIYSALLLYYVLQKDSVSKADKMIIIGALGYLISLIDIIPDFIPIVGYGDDITVLGLAVLKITKHIDSEVRLQAKEKIKLWFSLSETEIDKLV
ncbi:MAG: YkvA family protein [Fusobacteriaceae bacterium]